ncbi:MAG: hypothetical protein J6J37_07125 [Bacteroidaceae bacterium]|nr:hypothetical protein [Bacteroidaceae bacterium]
MKNTEGVPYGRGLEVPESSVLSVVLILLAIANIVTNIYLEDTNALIDIINTPIHSIVLINNNYRLPLQKKKNY